MLDSFRVVTSNFFFDTQSSQEVQNYFVATLHLLCETRSFVSQKYRPILLTQEQSLFLQPSNGPIDCDVTHSDPTRNIDQASLSSLFNQIRDNLDVVLGDFVRSRLPGFSVMLCLIGRFTTWSG
jgi:hypothetical protein